MKCTRQRCQVAPLRTLLTAAFSPRWLSEMTNCTPFQAPADQAAQELAPERLAFAGPDRQTQHAALAGLAHADGDHGRQTDDAVVLAHLQIDGIEPHVRIAVVQRPVAELLDQRIQFLAGPRHLALVHPVQPQALQQVIDLARAHALDVRLLHHRQQALSRRAAAAR